MNAETWLGLYCSPSASTHASPFFASMILYGSGLGDGNRHNHDDLPVVVFGKGGGALKTGQHQVHPDNTPLTNLYRSMLAIAGAGVDEFSDSTGLLDSVHT